ncbi:MAG: UDP-N-acetylmuramate dehydrogenase [Bacilli bacterium]
MNKDVLEEYGIVLENVSLKEYNSYGIGGTTRFLLKVDSVSLLVKLINYLTKSNELYFILGDGTNIILPDNDFSGVIIKLDKLNNYEIINNTVDVECGIKLNFLIRNLIKNGFTNMSSLAGIPGSLGGAIVGNAGSFGSSIMDFVSSVTILEDNEVKKISKEDIKYGYRTTEFKNSNVVVLSCILNLEKGDVEESLNLIKENNEKRINTQPLDYKNAGSVFKNPEGFSAGSLIDKLGLKGFTIGGAMVSEKHANFIINYNNATSSDIINLINHIKKLVKKEYNIDLELEQKIINW